MPAGIPMAGPGPQPMGALQHESMIQQQLAAIQQGALPVQQGMGSEGISPQRVPQPGMSPQQQQALATHLQLQAPQGKGCVYSTCIKNEQMNKELNPSPNNEQRDVYALVTSLKQIKRINLSVLEESNLRA